MSQFVQEDLCAVKGQQDIYGMGVRVGLYMQWYSMVLAYLYMADEASGLMITNYVFSIAVAIASLVNRREIYEHRSDVNNAPTHCFTGTTA